MKEKVILTREYREHLLKDPYRPAYHFAQPDDNGYPGDPNGAFFADGVYHLMYLYCNAETNGFHWGHMSSIDLIHWRHHPDALTIHEGDRGCYSGGAFLDEDKTAYLTFWKFPSRNKAKDKGGIAMACAKPPYDVWERMEPIAVESSDDWGVTDLEIDGETVHLGCADPSNIWKMNGKYYMQLGNLIVLDSHGRAESSQKKYKGDWTELFRSDDLKKWEYVGRFYLNPQRGVDDWPDETEDDMCPSFLPLYDAKEGGQFTGKYLQLFIAHNKGCQYYVGSLDGERFIPEQHGRMSWKDSAYFAPEALVDDRNRHIIWAWLRDNPDDDFHRFGWSSVYSFPRIVWLEGGELRMAPAQELDSLSYNRQVYVPEIHGCRPPVADGELCRFKGNWKGSEKNGLKVRISEDGSEYTEIYYSPEEKALVMDTSNSGKEGWKVRETAPFELREGETLSLDVFIDKCVVEVYANERQAICRRVYPTCPEKSVDAELIGKTEDVLKLETYRMFPANPY